MIRQSGDRTMFYPLRRIDRRLCGWYSKEFQLRFPTFATVRMYKRHDVYSLTSRRQLKSYPWRTSIYRENISLLTGRCVFLGGSLLAGFLGFDIFLARSEDDIFLDGRDFLDLVTSLTMTDSPLFKACLPAS